MKWYALGIALAIPAFAMADATGGGLSKVTTEMEGIWTQVTKIMNYVIAICLVLGAGHVVYAWSNGSGDMKKILINWVVALIVASVLLAIIPSPKG